MQLLTCKFFFLPSTLPLVPTKQLHWTYPIHDNILVDERRLGQLTLQLVSLETEDMLFNIRLWCAHDGEDES